MPCRSASGYPAGTPVRGPPARGPPGGPRGEISGPPARGPPGGPGRPRGPVWGPQYGHPKWALSGPFLMGFYNQMGGPGGTPLGVHFGPRGPGGPGGPKIGGPPGNGPSRAHTPTSVPTGRVIKYPRKCTPPGPPGGPPLRGAPRGVRDPPSGGSRYPGAIAPCGGMSGVSTPDRSVLLAIGLDWSEKPMSGAARRAACICTSLLHLRCALRCAPRSATTWLMDATRSIACDCECHAQLGIARVA